ncbi:hypothetical protein BN8_02614 [Fibrisoma limi BUZ 3]|uniref:Uncharacterized protein n=1 Tax=Fibrisoma limi BUZ 3 TaxID=1185876 RepID=I2GHY9_9BACT|nr:hypothetical protein BN8_02614 [Fibrisoma limi BUZ 3]
MEELIFMMITAQSGCYVIGSICSGSTICLLRQNVRGRERFV